jgi:hypothetical protein
LNPGSTPVPNKNGSRALINEIKFDMNRSDKYNDRYVIPMHRKNVWTNKWMQDTRKNFL